MRLWKDRCQDKYLFPEQLEEKVISLKNSGKSIATLNGSFDLLHAGHLQMIFEASELCDLLILALNSDSSIRQYKGATRPIIPLEYRLQMAAALEFVDYVTWFDETDPIKILELIKPNIHVNGPEYGENCIEAEVVKRYGGVIYIADKVPGLSTTAIINKIIEYQQLAEV